MGRKKPFTDNNPKMIILSEATTKDIITIQEIAKITWSHTYGEILSKAQIAYMLDLFYSDEMLHKNLESNHHFILAKEEEKSLGFASYEHHYQNKHQTRLHKLYVLPQAQKRGVGQLLIETIENKSKAKNDLSISLNVNRNNCAYLFYKKMGFQIVEEENIAIGNDYFMEDYKMEKVL
ncbi:GNAT family N-acetyltransferase [Flavobacterium luteum]|nr:GNAT family N-acetyltransferase [Flavobacterium luteum]